MRAPSFLFWHSNSSVCTNPLEFIPHHKLREQPDTCPRCTLADVIIPILKANVCKDPLVVSLRQAQARVLRLQIPVEGLVLSPVEAGRSFDTRATRALRTSGQCIEPCGSLSSLILRIAINASTNVRGARWIWVAERPNFDSSMLVGAPQENALKLQFLAVGVAFSLKIWLLDGNNLQTINY